MRSTGVSKSGMKFAGELSRWPSTSSQYGAAILACPVSQWPVSGSPAFQCTAPTKRMKSVIEYLSLTTGMTASQPKLALAVDPRDRRNEPLTRRIEFEGSEGLPLAVSRPVRSSVLCCAAAGTADIRRPVATMMIARLTPIRPEPACLMPHPDI